MSANKDKTFMSVSIEQCTNGYLITDNIHGDVYVANVVTSYGYAKTSIVEVLESIERKHNIGRDHV
jgi:hypothetical protein